MPTSWSIDAAHSSSRSPAIGSNNPASTTESNNWRGQRRRLSDESGERVARDREPLHADIELIGVALSCGREVADGTPDSNHATGGALQPLDFRQRAADVRPDRLELLLLRRPWTGKVLLGQAHGAELEGVKRLRAPAGDLDQLQAAAAELEHGAVGQRRGVDRGDVAVVRLLLLGENVDPQAGRFACPRQELLAVGRVTDRTRRARVP